MEEGALINRQPARPVAGRANRGGQRFGVMEEEAVISRPRNLNRANCEIGMTVMYSDDIKRKSYIGKIIACDSKTAKVQTARSTQDVPYDALMKREYSPDKTEKPCVKPTGLQVEHTDQWCEFADAELCITDLMQTDITRLRRMLSAPEGNHDEVNALLESDDFWRIKLERDTNCDPSNIYTFYKRGNEDPLYSYIRAMDNYLKNSGFSEDVKESIRQRIGF
jgi:hypothetical protein